MTAAILPTAGYALDQAWHAERARLDSLTSLYDERTLGLCGRLGLTAGWHCLDAGAGTGSLAAALAQRVGPTRMVTALDADTRFLAPLASERLTVVGPTSPPPTSPPGGSTSSTPAWCSSTSPSATGSSARSPRPCVPAAGC